MTYKDESSSDMDAISNNLLMINKSKEGSGMNLGQIDENSDSNTRLIDLAADRTNTDSAGNNQDKPGPKQDGVALKSSSARIPEGEKCSTHLRSQSQQVINASSSEIELRTSKQSSDADEDLLPSANKAILQTEFQSEKDQDDYIKLLKKPEQKIHQHSEKKRSESVSNISMVIRHAL